MWSRPLFALIVGISQASAVVYLNELRIDQPGGDNDEYLELFSDAPGADSLAGTSLIVIGDGAGGSGVIENVTDFSAVNDPFASDPYFLVAEGTFSVGVADFTTDLNFENSDNVTFLLVQNFSGMSGDDLDADDDGVLETTPWASVIDSISLHENVDGLPAEDGQEFSYGAAFGPVLGPDGTFVPGHAYRLGDGTGNWAIGDFSLGTDDTPGTANPIPEPSSTLLLLTGLLGFAARRRRA